MIAAEVYVVVCVKIDMLCFFDELVYAPRLCPNENIQAVSSFYGRAVGFIP